MGIHGSQRKSIKQNTRKKGSTQRQKFNSISTSGLASKLVDVSTVELHVVGSMWPNSPWLCDRFCSLYLLIVKYTVINIYFIPDLITSDLLAQCFDVHWLYEVLDLISGSGTYRCPGLDKCPVDDRLAIYIYLIGLPYISIW